VIVDKASLNAIPIDVNTIPKEYLIVLKIIGLIKPREKKPKNNLKKFLKSPLFLIQVSHSGDIASISVLATTGFNLFNTSKGKSLNFNPLLRKV
jgi:hypothetical protein